MRVLHVMGNFAPHGTERQLAETMLAAQRAALWDPTLCVLRAATPYSDLLRKRGVPVAHMGFASDADPRRLNAVRTLAKGFDVLHSSLWGANAFSRVALLGCALPPVVISERRVEHFRRPWQRAVDHALRQRTSHYIGNSTAVADFIVEWHGVPTERVFVVPNGINTSIFYPPSKREELLSRNGTVRLGAAGRLIPLKGFDVLIAAFRRVASAADVSLHIAGDGPERTRLELLAAGARVQLLGELETPEAMATFMRDLDVFVHASDAEGLPNVLLEAQACGVPVVATNAPGMADAVPEARLVRPRDPAALAHAILQEIADPRRSSSVAATDFATAAQLHFDVFVEALSHARGH